MEQSFVFGLKNGNPSSGIANFYVCYAEDWCDGKSSNGVLEISENREQLREDILDYQKKCGFTLGEDLIMAIKFTEKYPTHEFSKCFNIWLAEIRRILPLEELSFMLSDFSYPGNSPAAHRTMILKRNDYGLTDSGPSDI